MTIVRLAGSIALDDLVWALGSVAALQRRPFDSELLLRQLPAPPLTVGALVHAGRALGFRVKDHRCLAADVARLTLPCLVVLNANSGDTPGPESRLPLALVGQATESGVILFRAGTNTPVAMDWAEFSAAFAGRAFLFAPHPRPARDPDNAFRGRSPFGFRWFLPELLKHKAVWREVLLASLVIQLLALGTPLFTQVVIDKVVVHHSESTLMVIAIGLSLFTVFGALLTWVRQYLVLHTGNRVDAVLGSAVFEHIFKLPTQYFEHRPTGVITARLRGVETIREFIASAAVTLILDLPFLLIFVGLMFAYSVLLSVVCLALVGLIVGLSILVAPVFRERLNEQFLLGARGQAFATEYVAGLETVKSLQMEPQVKARYDDYLAEYLRSGFGVRQIANTYNVLANSLEQTLSLLILVFGARLVMSSTDFTIGMLVAFQMFASRVSQPLLRLVGLWQQFQQASLSVARLGDLMNAPAEHYSVVPARVGKGRGLIEIEDLSFRYAENLPFLLRGFNLRVEPGRVVAIMGPSGCGKSTLAKLLQGLYAPTDGRIRIDGLDIRHLAANELRQNFGVVPQETILFSGTVYENLLMANPLASFEQIANACRTAEIHDVIERLPQGYQTDIGERGAGLSGGQKQRIAIARALLKQPRILVFDEATSNLDSPTAEQFTATINQLKGKVTMLFITHAVPKSLQVDEIIRIGGERPAAARDAAVEMVGRSLGTPA